MKYKFMPGKPCVFTEEEMMAKIRAVLAEDIECEREFDPRSFLRRSIRDRAGVPRRRSYFLPQLKIQEHEESARNPRIRSDFMPAAAAALDGLFFRFLAFRPTTRQLSAVCTVLLFVLRPLWFVVVPIIGLTLFFAMFAVLGADRSWRFVSQGLSFVERRDPIRATMWRDRLNRFGYRWDRFLNFFPEGSVDGLYMPDFQWMARIDLQPAIVSPKRLHRFFPQR